MSRIVVASPQASVVMSAPATYAAAPSSSVVMAAPTYAAAPMQYAAAPMQYAAAPQIVRQPAPTYSAPPMQYAAAPVQFAAAPPMQYAAAPMTYAAAPQTYAAAPMTFAAAPAAQSGRCDRATAARLRQAFNAADRDGTGQLDHDELAGVMQQCGIQVPGGAKDLRARFTEFDTDHSGRVSFSEFVAAVYNKKPNAPGPKHEGTFDQQGKYVDASFPPNNNSVFASPNPAADHVEDVKGHAAGGITWRRAAELCGEKQGQAALFKNVHPNDIAQGVLGDCWLLAAMAGLAEFEGAIFNLFQNKSVTKDGKYTINMFNPQTRKWDSITIDDFVPCVNNEPIMAKPQDHEMWVLLLEKAFAKWFGSYCQIQGAYCMVAYMFMVDCGGPCKVFTQSQSGRPPFDANRYKVMEATIQDAKNRNSVGLNPVGDITGDHVWEELKKADDSNHVMSAWTSKDPAGPAAGRGASGEVIASDGIVKGHAYSLISAREVRRDDGQTVRCVQLRNPWGANPAAEYKGDLSDNWPGWSQYPKMKAELLGSGGKLDGMFWMSFDAFRDRYSDCGIVPTEMPTYKLGQVEGSKSGQKHGRRWFSSSVVPTASKSGPKKAKVKKGKGCCA